MQLEKITLNGFKSFANKTVIQLDSGVTAIVGPNGSGKSNLSEAIKWVLGEQSAKSLRGKKMEDLIFSGSDSKKAVNFCEVSLQFNNEDHFLPLDYNEVIITRRYHRNGDSEYLINKKPSRLKDITLLLMDSGFSKGAFSMISQGKVEEIFNNKPEERRSIIEEAAGVLTYKMQKSEAERKLKKTEDHLDRLKDIIYELEQQLEPLRNQKESAETYLDLDKEKSKLEVQVLTAELTAAKTQYDHSQSDLVEQNRLIEKLNHQKQAVKVKRDQVAKDRSYKESDQATVEDKNVANQTKKARIEGEIALVKERLTHLLQTGTQQTEQTEQSLKKQKDLEAQIKVIGEKVDAVAANELKVKTELAALKALLNKISETELPKVEDLRDEYFGLLQQTSKMHQQLAQLEKEKETQTHQLEKSNQAVSIKESELAKTNHKIEVNDEQLAEKTNQLVETTKHHETLGITAKKQSVSYQEAEAKWQHLKNDYHQQLATYNSLERLADDYAGFFAGVKAILKKKKQLPGIVGSVAEVISVPEKFEEAITVLLGGSAQNVIVRDEQSADAAITYLKKEKMGRATFMPLTTMKKRTVSSIDLAACQSFAGFIGVAIDLVSYDELVEPAISNVLGGYIVVDHLKTAHELAQKTHFHLRIVTLNGDLLYPGGSLTGGQKRSKGPNLIGRTRQLSALQKKLKELEKARKKEKEILVAKSAEKERLSQQLVETSNQLRDLEIKQKELAAEKRFLTEESGQLTQALKVARYEAKLAQEDLEQIISDIKTIKPRINEVEQQSAQKKTEIEKSQTADTDRAEEQRKIQQTIFDAEKEFAVQVERRQALVNEQASYKAQLESLISETAMLTTNQESAKDSQKRLEEKEAELLIELEKVDLDQQHINQEKIKIQKILEESDRVISSLSAKETEISETLEKHHYRMTTTEKALTRYESVMDQKLSLLTEEYHISYEKALEVEPLTVAVASGRQRVTELKQAIKKLGPVNLAAIEDFDEINDRYIDLSQQKADLDEAKEELWSTMKTMDQEVIKRFKKTFESVNQHFEETFPQLFGGGQARLELTDPKDLLTTGIEIVAQPPGKKLQSLSLLSGGERALTAIALLFAILQTKPVPFCLLDEVEAALDDANVDRYGRYLKTFTPQTQFMVITHRKGTMEQADILYGVTMQESGISKMASVKLAEIDDRALV
ncbi:MAG TPA: chromosome segregation protein SMC [Bavariicoccus seileri]|uniref:Chromosome partition protein Smc n=1 Tax=Bavariicoccus seileri TaxID=549685 RepID=A0A3D4S4M8_9ENTE|nr:chromosome segregation protein SMC [Bavariicoccus seileri]HCS93795.1 chromosome segregation protein SMC [Bavariicoccus seileri]